MTAGSQGSSEGECLLDMRPNGINGERKETGIESAPFLVPQQAFEIVGDGRDLFRRQYPRVRSLAEPSVRYRRAEEFSTCTLSRSVKTEG